MIVSRGPAEELATAGLMLRRYRIGDAAAISEAIEQSRASLETWTPEIATRRTTAEIAAGLAALDLGWNARRKQVYGAFDARMGRFVGEAGLYAIDWPTQVAEIGVWLRTGAEGQGLGRQALGAVATHALDDLGLKLLEAFIHPLNERSCRLVEHVGFHLVGTAPGALHREFRTDGDVLVYRRGKAPEGGTRQLS